MLVIQIVEQKTHIPDPLGLLLQLHQLVGGDGRHGGLRVLLSPGTGVRVFRMGLDAVGAWCKIAGLCVVAGVRMSNSLLACECQTEKVSAPPSLARRHSQTLESTTRDPSAAIGRWRCCGPGSA